MKLNTLTLNQKISKNHQTMYDYEKKQKQQFEKQQWVENQKDIAPPYQGEIQKGDVVWTRFYFSNNRENYKIRPAIVFQRPSQTSGDTFTTIPMTTSGDQRATPTHVPIRGKSVAEIECLTCSHRNDIVNKYYSLTEEELKQVSIAILTHFGFL